MSKAKEIIDMFEKESKIGAAIDYLELTLSNSTMKDAIHRLKAVQFIIKKLKLKDEGVLIDIILGHSDIKEAKFRIKQLIDMLKKRQ